VRRYIFCMSSPTFTPEESEAVIALLKRTLAEDRFPFAPRLRPLRSALEKLSPTTVISRPLPVPKEPFKAEDRPRFGNAAKRSRRGRALG
jgi:hypothetical protein